MAKKKKQPRQPPTINDKGKVEAGVEPRQIPVGFFESEEFNALNTEEQRFVEEWLMDRNGTRAYMRAGLRARSYGAAAVAASFLLKTDKVSAAIQKAKDAWKDAVQEDLTTIAANFQQIREKCMREVPVLDHEGNPTGEYTFQASAAISANKELGLAIGALRNRVEMTGKDGGAIAVKVEGVVRLEMADLSKLTLGARKEILQLLEAKESANGTH